MAKLDDLEELIITRVYVATTDTGEKYLATQVFRYEYDDLNELEAVLLSAETHAIEGSILHTVLI